MMGGGGVPSLLPHEGWKKLVGSWVAGAATGQLEFGHGAFVWFAIERARKGTTTWKLLNPENTLTATKPPNPKP